ncbi:ATP-binding protein [Serratia marcescens]|uniref:ATP-binding protein n=1 Tax=Serratia marcescens TaxID=615 RepID=UPI000A865C27|nr:ATP-binding protein [Serratia marcescens]
MKDYVLKDLSGVFIIDDLERIPQSLRDEIATYCLQNYQNDNQLDYILVGNFSKQSNEILNHKEKVISDEIYFSINNLSEILELKLSDVESNCRNTIAQVIIGFEESNLRIINRIIVKLLPLIKSSTSGNEISDIDIKNLVSSLCAHIILKEKFSYQESDFHENYITSSLKTLTVKSEKESGKISKEESNLLNITAYKSYNNNMVPYCFNVISQKDILPYIFITNKHLERKDYAALVQPELCKISEKDYLDEIESVILKTNSPKLSVWLTATSNYLRLLESKYIQRIKGLSNKKIEEKKLSFSEDEVKAYFRETHPNVDDIPSHVLRRDGNDLYNFFLTKYSEIMDKEKIKELREKMINGGWIAIDIDIYQSKFKFKLLETLDVKIIIDAIKNTWSIHDIKTFSDHLSSQYNFSNLADFLSGELPYLKKLYSGLNSYQRKIPNSFRRGAIIELTNCVKRVKESLEGSISIKADSP